MAETTADVRRDIEQTRERMSTTLTELEQRLNVMQVVRDHDVGDRMQQRVAFERVGLIAGQVAPNMSGIVRRARSTVSPPSRWVFASAHITAP